MGVTDAGTVALECMGMVDAVRVKSKRLQGPLSSVMKNKIKKVNEVIRVLIQMGEASGDPLFWETKSKKLADELVTVKKELDRNKSENVALKKEKENLWNEITKLRIEVEKIDELKSENDSLWKAINDMRKDMRKLSRERSPERLNRGESDLETRLAFRDDVSPVAGPSGVSAASGTPLAITPVPGNKEEVKIHVSNMIKKLKNVRKQEKKQDENEAGLDMSWDQVEHTESPLPQRLPRPSKPSIVANVQLVPPREEIRSDTEQYLSPSVKGDGFKGSSRKRKTQLGRRGDEHEERWTEVVNKNGRGNRKGKEIGLAKEQGKMEPKPTSSSEVDRKRKA
ncbi:unnamed protein product [Lasius platythorax]|uniref:Uncharacterized protein n=1 Tax=Lasius platythorax TaxID=488582 RepID=A0AAV2MXZ4_9HYME